MSYAIIQTGGKQYKVSASKIIADGNLTSSFHSLYVETSITASGDISASGNLDVNSGSFNHIHLYQEKKIVSQVSVSVWI